jgi:methylmalonyl-CoA carboxyltransferase large subunit
MSSKKEKLQQVLEAVESLRDEVSSLNQRVVKLEAVLSRTTELRTAQEAERLSEELVLTISAAIAAYLGVKPRIRQIRLVGSSSWAKSGRTTIQASHSIAPQHG